eukprot:1386151-Pyramimonas_sp.AAC.1
MEEQLEEEDDEAERRGIERERGKRGDKIEVAREGVGRVQFSRRPTWPCQLLQALPVASSVN